MRASAVLLVAVAIGVPRQIEPVTRPFLTVVWRCQQPVDLLLICGWTVVVQKRSHLLRRGREPDEIEAQPSKKCSLVCGRRRRQALAFKARSHERIESPCVRLPQWLKCPVC